MSPEEKDIARRSPKSLELENAWYCYCLDYRLIAYGDLTGDEPDEYADWYVEKRAYELYMQELEEIEQKWRNK